MKKLLHIFLLTIYLPAALGVGFNVHYCGGEVESVEVFSYTDHGCICHDTETGCCNDDWKFVKLDDNSQRTQPGVSFNFSPVSLFIQPIEQSDLSHVIALHEIGATYSHGPPVIYNNPVYLRFRALLI